jgi:hypothetical protein
MKLRRWLGLTFFFCAVAAHALSLDREAFTFTHYDLTVRVEPEQQRLGVRGRITLRNDSAIAQKIAVLQISSSLDWRSITSAGKPLPFVGQPFTSDIDHTGRLTEAIVTLPTPVAPGASVDLDIAYEGVIVQDATRLTRIDTPEDVARDSDWDQIGAKFTAVRGVGYVAWYPIATEAASLTEQEDFSAVLGRWKARHAESSMNLLIRSTSSQTIIFSGSPAFAVAVPEEQIKNAASYTIARMGTNVPTFVLEDLSQLQIRGLPAVYYLTGSERAAQAYLDLLSNLDPFPAATGWRRLQIVQMPNADASPFVGESMLLLPFKSEPTEEDRLATVYAMARSEWLSPRGWITEGLGHYAQARDIEERKGRQAAIGYLVAHLSVLVSQEKERLRSNSAVVPESAAASTYSLIDCTDEVLVGAKAMWVWWMLHDMLGNANMELPLREYKASADKEPSYVQRLIERQTHRDLEWFFDDWVYRDRGLPDFKVESAFARKTMNDAYLVTVTIANLGRAGAEVPVIVKFAGGEVMKRLEVRGNGKGIVRVELSRAPEEVVVNDGSVPESDMTNNGFKFEITAPAK